MTFIHSITLVSISKLNIEQMLKGSKLVHCVSGFLVSEPKRKDILMKNRKMTNQHGLLQFLYSLLMLQRSLQCMKRVFAPWQFCASCWKFPIVCSKLKHNYARLTLNKYALKSYRQSIQYRCNVIENIFQWFPFFQPITGRRQSQFCTYNKKRQLKISPKRILKFWAILREIGTIYFCFFLVCSSLLPK